MTSPLFVSLAMKLERTQIQKVLPEGVILLEIVENTARGALKLVVDTETTLDADLTAGIARAVRDAGILDRIYPQGYQLEVTSPGVGAPLAYPFQFRKNIGRRLELILQNGPPGEPFEAELVEADEAGIRVQGRSGLRQIDYGQIRSAKVVLQF